MTADEVLRLAEPLLRAVFPTTIESIAVREDEDWSGTPSLFIDVFLVPGTRDFDIEAYGRMHLTLSDRLVAAGEPRFPYVRLRDRVEEAEEAPDEAA